MEKIIELDKKIFLFFNTSGSETFDAFFKFITHTWAWTPFFIFLAYLVYKKLGWKNLAFVIVTIAIIILVCDQTTNFVKNSFQRLRPCNTEDLKPMIRIVKHSDTYSFFSGHASNSLATMTFIFLLLKNHYKKYLSLIFLYPLIFAYSRIYLGLHFPFDVLVGYIFGCLVGIVFYKIFYEFYLYKEAKIVL